MIPKSQRSLILIGLSHRTLKRISFFIRDYEIFNLTDIKCQNQKENLKAGPTPISSRTSTNTNRTLVTSVVKVPHSLPSTQTNWTISSRIRKKSMKRYAMIQLRNAFVFSKRIAIGVYEMNNSIKRTPQLCSKSKVLNSNWIYLLRISITTGVNRCSQ
jgi:hypothetical protein